MCRNIRPLFNFEPPASDAEIRAASVQFVRKLCGFARPSQANQAAFDRAVDEVAESVERLMGQLVTRAVPSDRESVAAAAKARSAKRFPQRAGQPSEA